jgi:hypothetical protein
MLREYHMIDIIELDFRAIRENQFYLLESTLKREKYIFYGQMLKLNVHLFHLRTEKKSENVIMHVMLVKM